MRYGLTNNSISRNTTCIVSMFCSSCKETLTQNRNTDINTKLSHHANAMFLTFKQPIYSARQNAYPNRKAVMDILITESSPKRRKCHRKGSLVAGAIGVVKVARDLLIPS